MELFKKDFMKIEDERNNNVAFRHDVKITSFTKQENNT